jgi:hypothetical protein
MSLLVVFAGVSLIVNDPPEGMIENPLYRSWAKFPPGTVAVFKAVADNGKNRISTTTTYKLLSKSEDRLTVESVVLSNLGDVEYSSPPQNTTNPRYLKAPPGAKRKSPAGKPEGVSEEGTEKIKVAGREYAAKWYKSKTKVEAGETLSKTWMSDDVPTGLLKSELDTPGARAKTVMELVELKIPEGEKPGS